MGGEDNAQRHRSVHGLGIRRCPVDARNPVDQHVNVRNPPPTVMRVPFADFAALHELRYVHSSVRLSYGACMVWACLLERSIPETLINLPGDSNHRLQAAGACLVQAVVPRQKPRRFVASDQNRDLRRRLIAFAISP